MTQDQGDLAGASSKAPALSEGERVGRELHDQAIHMTGLCEVLCEQMGGSIGQGEFDQATNLSFAYECLATLAKALSDKLSEVSP